MEIVFYRPEYRRAFIDLNTAWLREYFCVEAEDEKIFSSVDQMVREGAGVFVALQAGRPVAVCMTMPLGGDEWEICKLAADKACRRRGAGEGVLRACMAYAAAHGAKKLTVLSNRSLTAAMGLYAKVGFRETPVTHGEYARVNVQFEREV